MTKQEIQEALDYISCINKSAQGMVYKIFESKHRRVIEGLLQEKLKSISELEAFIEPEECPENVLVKLRCEWVRHDYVEDEEQLAIRRGDTFYYPLNEGETEEDYSRYRDVYCDLIVSCKIMKQGE